ncbi:MAG: methylenetetrahydrofolate reductase [Deltaproteobacteria bacterium]|jgi:methylenetetrahydrofolate reductase (NADPH)|nr:methylenetetrahydrofolate reductase [Deltaproteobacteria bacterium]MBW2532721.1 methylenetetrahydrofolate reductase [Deltaproteobacteria bacterium]
MRVSELPEKKGGRRIISFEVSRAKTDKAAANLDKALARMKAAEPDYVSVTFGAGGSTREGSFELLGKLQEEMGFDVVAYLACVGLGPDELVACLDQFQALGVETVLAIRGDTPTWDESFQAHPEALAHASDLVAFIKSRYDFCVGVAGYPEGHLEAESEEADLRYLKLKVDQGADYVVAQYFYDNQLFFDFVERARSLGIEVPIYPGIMPIYTVKLMENLARICGATITEAVRDGLARLPPDDKQAVVDFGIELATEQCRGLLRQGVDGLHFYTMNRAKSVGIITSTLREEGLL